MNYYASDVKKPGFSFPAFNIMCSVIAVVLFLMLPAGTSAAAQTSSEASAQSSSQHKWDLEGPYQSGQYQSAFNQKGSDPGRRPQEKLVPEGWYEVDQDPYIWYHKDLHHPDPHKSERTNHPVESLPSSKGIILQDDPGVVFELEIDIADPADNLARLALGLHPEATEGYDDGHDVYSPPPFPGTFFAGIVRMENGMEENYARLYLPAGTPSAVWPIRIQAGDAGFPIDMSWDPAALPDDIVVRLQDTDGNMLVSMQDEVQHVVQQGDPLEMQIFYTSDPVPDHVLPSDSLALMDFYFDTGEARQLEGWLYEPVSEWYGVTVEGNRVTGLEIPWQWNDDHDQLTGSIPESLGNLDDLRFLNLTNHEIGGILPESLLQLNKLESLSLFGNNFEGEWYTADFWSAFPKMEVLYMGRDELTGSITPEIAGMPELRVLQLMHTQLSGTLPSELSLLTDVSRLAIQAPDITGKWPSGASDLQNLSMLYLTAQLDETIEEVMEQLPKDNLTSLFFSGPFVDKIPELIGSFDALEALVLSSHELTGPLPDFVTTMESLISLQIMSSPNLDGPLPEDWSGMKNLELLNLRNNNLSGTLPESIGELPKLRMLSLSDNPGLGGLLPESYLSIENLTYFDYYGTEIRTPVIGEFRTWLKNQPGLNPNPQADLPAVTLTKPAYGEYLSSPHVTFEWEALELADVYQFELYSDSAMTELEHFEFHVDDIILHHELNEDRSDYYWRVCGAALIQREQGGAIRLLSDYSDVSVFSISRETAAENEEIPLSFALNTNYPNPFNPSTVIGYQLPVDSDVRLEVFDLLGRRVDVLVSGFKPAGMHQVIFDGSRLAGGVYMYRLRAGSFQQTNRMMLIK